MIKYKLICKNCDFTFDSWFASSAEYEKLKTKKFLNCHNCNSKKIEKTLMAPKLINNHSSKMFEKKKKNNSKDREENDSETTPQPMPQAEEMSPDEAQRLLDAMRQDEENKRSQLRPIMGTPFNVERDW